VLAGVLKAKHEEEKQNAEFCTKFDELLGKIEGKEAAIAECQPSEKIQGNGGESQASSQACEHGQADGDAAQLYE